MAKASGQRVGRTVQSVEIAFEILDALQEDAPLTVTELERTLDYSRSTIHSHLRTLEAHRIIVRKNYTYRLSLRVLDMAEHVRDRVGNYDVICSEVDDLAEETGETVQFGIEEHGMVSYLYKTTGDNGIKSASRVGSRQPMYSTGLGKTILAFLPDERAKAIARSCKYEGRTSNTVSGPTELFEELERIRERGYGIDDEENVNGLRCVASPVKDDDDKILGAVSITGPSSRLTMDRIHGDLSDRVQNTANLIEINSRFS